MMKGFRLFLLSLMLLVFCYSITSPHSATVGYAEEASQADSMKRNPTLSRHAEAILTRLMSANQINPQDVRDIAVVESREYNAATDGKVIYFTDTLWNALSSDDQRAFVIGHELSHIKLGHIKQTAYRRIAFQALDRLVFDRVTKGNQRFQQFENIGLSLIDMKFSRKMEYAADDLGMLYMTRARYNPRGAIEAFEVLSRHEGSSSPEFLRNHPLTGSRIRELSKKYTPPGGSI